MSWLDQYFHTGIKSIADSTGTALPYEPQLQLTGSGVSVADDPITGQTVATITAGGGVALAGDLGHTTAVPYVIGWYDQPLDSSMNAPAYDGGLAHWASGTGWIYGGAHAVQVDAIGTAQTAGVTLRNTTAATALLSQYSPMLVLEGRGWAGASVTAQAALQFGPHGLLTLYTNLAGGGWLTPLGLGGSAVLFDGTASATIKLSDLGTAGDGKTITIGGGAVTSGAGTDVLVTGGSATGTDQNGGEVRLASGDRTGSGSLGKVQVEDHTGAAISQWFDDGTVCLLVGASDGIAHISGGGFVSSSAVVDADITGPISGSKINPVFGAQDASASSFTGILKSTAATVAAAGDIRLGATALAKWYDGTADRTLFDYNGRASNTLGLGSQGTPTRIFGTALTLLATAWPGDPVAGDVGKSLSVTAANTLAYRTVGARIRFACNSTGLTTLSRYVPDSLSSNVVSTDIVRQQIPFAGVLKNFYVRQQSAGSSDGGAGTYTLYYASTAGGALVATGLTVTVNNDSSAQVSDTTHSQAVAAGSEIALLFQHAGTPTTAASNASAVVSLLPAT